MISGSIFLLRCPVWTAPVGLLGDRSGTWSRKVKVRSGLRGLRRPHIRRLRPSKDAAPELRHSLEYCSIWSATVTPENQEWVTEYFQWGHSVAVVVVKQDSLYYYSPGINKPLYETNVWKSEVFHFVIVHSPCSA